MADPSDVENAVVTAMDRWERKGPLQVVAWALICIAIGLLPMLAIPALPWLMPDLTPQEWSAVTNAQLPPEARALEIERRKLLGASLPAGAETTKPAGSGRLTAPPFDFDAPASSPKALERWKDIEARQAALDTMIKADRTTREAAALAGQRAFQANTWFAAAATVLAALSLTVLFAQTRLINRHWQSIFGDRNKQFHPGTARDELIAAAIVPIFFAGLTVLGLGLFWGSGTWAEILTVGTLAATGASLLLGRGEGNAGARHAPGVTLGLALVLTFFVSLAVESGLQVPWHGGTLELGKGLSRVDWLGVVLLTLVLTATAITTFAVLCYGRCYPTISQLQSLLHTCGWTDESAPAGIKAAWSGRVDALVAAAQANPSDNAANTMARMVPPLPVSRRLSASAAVEMVRILVRALAAVYVVALITVSLALDSAEQGHLVDQRQLVPPSQAYIDAVSASLDAWMWLIGISFSLVLAAIYLAAVMQLDPYVAAEADADPKKPVPTTPVPEGITGRATLLPGYPSGHWTLNLTQRPAATPKTKVDQTRELAELILSRHWAMTPEKRDTVVAAACYGASFQDLLGQDVKQRTQQLATLLAPAVAGSLFALL